MTHHVIYIPGLGDHHARTQHLAIQLWRLFGLTPHFLPLTWNRADGYKAKQKRVLDLIDQLSQEGDSIAVVGVSAGASAAINTYALTEKVSRVICICGKIKNPQTIRKRKFKQNPDFESSLNRVNSSLAQLTRYRLGNIMSIHPWKDYSVPVADTIIEGAKEKTMPGWSHASGIFWAITFGSPQIARFIKKRTA